MRLEYGVEGKDFTAAGEVSSRIKGVLRRLGLDPGLIRRVVVAAYEAEMNIVIHARRGTLGLEVSSDALRLSASDEGPGIEDIDLAMQEGFSTAPEEIREMGFGAGMGLPNIKRAADSFSIESVVGSGTRLEAVIYVESKEEGDG